MKKSPQQTEPIPVLDRLHELKSTETAILKRIAELSAKVSAAIQGIQPLSEQASEIAADLGKQEIQRIEFDLLGKRGKPSGSYTTRDLESVREAAAAILADLQALQEEAQDMTGQISDLSNGWDIPYLDDKKFLEAVYGLNSNLSVVQRDLNRAKVEVGKISETRPMLAWHTLPRNQAEYASRTKFECTHCRKTNAILVEVNGKEGIFSCSNCRFSMKRSV